MSILNRILSSRFCRRITRFIAYPIVKKYVDADLAQLSEKPNLLPIIIPTADLNVAYLRTDFWLLGKSSNGAMAHTIGVLASLKKQCAKIMVYSICKIDYIDDTIPQIINAPKGWLVGLNELQEMEYSHRMASILYEQLKDNPPSFIYQRYGRNNYTGVWVAKLLNIPCVMEYNGSEIWMAQNWGKPLRYTEITEKIELAVFNAADLIVGNAKALKEELVNRGVNSNKIFTVPNGVDISRFDIKAKDYSVIRKQYNISTNNIVVSFVGSFGPWHGATVLASAIKNIIKHNNNIRFMFVGTGPQLEQVKDIVKSDDVEQYTIFTGNVPMNVAPLYLADSDILVSPQIPNPDGTPFFGSPTKLFEYMASGKAIVASNLDQIGEILSNDYSALLTTPGNVGDIEKAILKLANDYNLRSYLGKNAKNEVIEKYTWDTHVLKILNLINNQK